jgi:CRISPR/Cas system-associated exonuclease Cas4 (RecB family)
LNISIISPAQNLIEEIISHLSGTNRDYSSNLVIFPGKRPSHFLRKALAENIKGSFIPPVIYSMDEFINSICESIETKKKLEAIDAVAILYEIHKKAKKPIGGSGFMMFERFFSIGLKIYNDIEELYINGISSLKVKEIQPFIDNVVPEQTAKNLQSLFFFYEEFYKEIEKQNLSTRSTRYRIASEKFDEVGIDRFCKTIAAGFFALTQCEKNIFKKLLSMGNAVFIFQDGHGIRENLIDIGIKPEDKEAYISDISEQDISFYSSPDTHGQVYAVSNVLHTALQKDGKIDENTAIVMPSSDTLFPLLRQGLSFMEAKEFNVSMGYPLFRTPVVGFFNNLMDLISSMDGDKFYVPDYLRFVLHPYTKNIFFNSSAEMTRILFHTIEEELTENRTKTFLSLSEIEEDIKMLSDFLKKAHSEQNTMITSELAAGHLKYIHDNTVRKFLAFENIGDFAKKCNEVLTFIYHNSTAKLHPFFHPFAESFLIALDAVSRSLMSSMAFSNINSYFSFIRKYLMTSHIPFEGTPIRGLQVLGFLETRNLKFKRLLILDANEEVLPDTKRQDSLLPFQARRMLGIPTYIERDKISAYYFENLIRGAEHVHLFFIENDAKERSRFVERLIWEKQKKDKTTETNSYINSVQYKVRLSNKAPVGISKTKEVVNFLKGFAYSASAIDTYLRCGLQFYYSYVMGIKESENISGEIERADIGKFVHRSISAFFSTRKGYALTNKDMDINEMNRLVERFFTEDYGNDPVGAIYLLKNQVKSRMRDVLKRYYIPLIEEETLIVLDSEYKINASECHFNITGRIDSIEKRGNKIMIIDYKTGSNPNNLRINFDKLDPDNRDTWSKAIGSLQLPFYLMLYWKHTVADIRDMNAMFLLLGHSVVSKDIELQLFKDRDAEKTYNILKGIILYLLEEIINPQIQFSPAADKKKTCPHCAFRSICGTQWIVRT